MDVSDRIGGYSRTGVDGGEWGWEGGHFSVQCSFSGCGFRGDGLGIERSGMGWVSVLGVEDGAVVVGARVRLTYCR